MYDLRAFIFFCFKLIISSIRAIKEINPHTERHKKSSKLSKYLGPSSIKKCNEELKFKCSIE